MSWNATTYLEQVALKSMGYEVGAIDGISGPKTFEAKSDWMDDRNGESKPNQPPSSDYRSMIDYYGVPGDESELVRIDFPYEMKLAWDKSVKVTRSRCHSRIAKPLLAALNDLLETYGIEWIKKHGLDLYGGIYNNRNARGGSTKSKHAWGAAIDLNPSDNGNRTKWRLGEIGQDGFATMPIEAIEAFEAHGFKSGARAWGRDAMHFQFTT
jgi:hypothetical protein